MYCTLYVYSRIFLVWPRASFVIFQTYKQMKQLYKRKKRAYDVLKAKQLCGLAKADPAAFWKWYRKRAEGVNGITSEALRDGF